MTVQGPNTSPHARRHFWAVASLLVALALTAPAALAGGSLQAGPVVVLVEDDRGTACTRPVAGFCFFNVTRDDGTVGSMEIDGEQRIQYVGVAADADVAGTRLANEVPIPVEAILVRGDDLYVRYAEPTLANDTFRGERITTPLGDQYWVRLTDEKLTVGWWGPTTKNATAPFSNQTYTVVISSSQGNMSAEPGYRRTYDLNDGVAPRSTDPLLDDGPEMACFALLKLIMGYSACSELNNATLAHVYAATPNARVGYVIEDVQVAPSPEKLTPPRATVPGVAGANATDEHTYAPAAILPDEGMVVAAATPREETFGFRSAPQAPETRLLSGVTGKPVPASTLSPASTAPVRPTEGGALPATVAVVGLAIGAFLSALYSRFTTKRDALASATRATLAATVRTRPGIPWMDAARELGLTRNALGHHVRVMERAGVLTVVKAEGKRFLYHTADRPLQGGVPLPVLQHPVRGTLLKWLVGTPEGLTRDDLARGFPHVPERSRRYHIERLIALGLAREEEVASGERRIFARPLALTPTSRQP